MRIWRRVFLITAVAVASCLLFGVMVGLGSRSQACSRPRQAHERRDGFAATGGDDVRREPDRPDAEPDAGGARLGRRPTRHAQGRKGPLRVSPLFWRDDAHEVDIVSGPAMSMSPAATLALPRSAHGRPGLLPYPPPSPVMQQTVAGRKAIYFDATPPPLFHWALVGKNPPELSIDADTSFRMAALSVRGKTVVIVVRAPMAGFTQFLPIAERLLASLRFPPS